MTEETTTPGERVAREAEDLEEKMQKLLAFLRSPAYGRLGCDHQDLLAAQAQQMMCYYTTLAKRLVLFTWERRDACP